MWVDAVYGLLLSFVPLLVGSFFVQKYVMYLAKLGWSRLRLAFIALVLIALMGFVFTSGLSFAIWSLFKPEYKPWLFKGGWAGCFASLFVVWLRVCLKLGRYQASYFIEYTYPRPSIITGVPLLMALIFAFTFWRSGLIETGAGYLATKTRNPTFCRLVRDKDHCQEQFYAPELVEGARIDPALCRSLSGSHVIKCLIAHHPNQPDVANCRVLRDREGEDASVYYWCLGYLPESHETKEACRRAESSNHWINAYYGGCVKESEVNERIESGKTVLMHFLDVKQLSDQPGGLRKLGVKHSLPIRTELAALLGSHPDLERTDRDGRTLLFYVHKINDLKALLEHGAKVNHLDQNGLSAPMAWMNFPNPERQWKHMELIAKHGYDVNSIDKKGRQVLIHYLLTLKEQSPEAKESPEALAFVETLLKLGANPYLRDKNKKRAVDYAREMSLNQISGALRNYRSYHVQPAS